MSTIDTPAPAPGFRLTGWRVLAIFVVFFSVVIGVDTLFSVFALRTFSGEAAKDPYEAGILFNQTLAKRRAEAALGWQAVWTRTRR